MTSENRGRFFYKKVSELLVRLQGELFVLGADLATPLDVKVPVPRITKRLVVRLEREIDGLDAKLPKLKNFILPGGGEAGATLHLARTICRRAERAIAALAETERINQVDLVYVNRLSDWLFVLARYVNKLEGQAEKIWQGRK